MDVDTDIQEEGGGEGAGAQIPPVQLALLFRWGLQGRRAPGEIPAE